MSENTISPNANQYNHPSSEPLQEAIQVVENHSESQNPKTFSVGKAIGEVIASLVLAGAGGAYAGATIVVGEVLLAIIVIAWQGAASFGGGFFGTLLAFIIFLGVAVTASPLLAILGIIIGIAGAIGGAIIGAIVGIFASTAAVISDYFASALKQPISIVVGIIACVAGYHLVGANATRGALASFEGSLDWIAYLNYLLAGVVGLIVGYLVSADISETADDEQVNSTDLMKTLAAPWKLYGNITSRSVAASEKHREQELKAKTHKLEKEIKKLEQKIN